MLLIHTPILLGGTITRIGKIVRQLYYFLPPVNCRDYQLHFSIGRGYSNLGSNG